MLRCPRLEADLNALRALLAIVTFFLAPAATWAEDVLRVGTSGDYPPFSLAIEAEIVTYDGFDLDVAHAFAEANGFLLAPTRFRWPHLIRDFEANRFDVAMSGVTITPERSALGRFSVPVAETGAVVLVVDAARYPTIESLNASSVRIGVNAGGYLEGVANATFRKATLLAIPDNASVLAALVEGNLAAVVTRLSA